MVTGVEIRVEFAEGDLQRLEAIGQSLGHSIAAEEESSLGGAHGINVQVSHRSHVLGEDGIQPIHFALQLALGGVRQRLMWRVVVFVGTRRDGRKPIAVLGILDRLVDMQGDDANRADATRFRHEQSLGAGGNRIGR